jgi:hypothetical protein
MLALPAPSAPVEVAIRDVAVDPPRNTCELPAGYLSDKLDDAERLLRYAAETGTETTDSVRAAVLNARMQQPCGMSEQTAADLLAALTTLTATARPVTAETLKASADPEKSKAVFREYTRVAFLLSIFIIPFSLLTFASSALSDAIRKDTDTANALAVKLSDELGPPRVRPESPINQTDKMAPVEEGAPSSNNQDAARIGVSRLPRGISEKDAIRDLQQFAATLRAIDARARQLNVFMLNQTADPLAPWRDDRAKMRVLLELPADLPDLPHAAADKIVVYQDIRYFAQSIQEMVSIWYGAVAATVLPVLYSLLGACAYLLRSFQEQIRTRTFTSVDGHSARFLIAAIGGFVVGMFNNFNISQGIALSPLAIAFLVGYAVDVFFTFLEGILQAFDRSRAGAKASAPVSKR